jgi:hypothetical protein
VDPVRNTVRIAPSIANRGAVLLALILISFALEIENLVMFGPSCLYIENR